MSASLFPSFPRPSRLAVEESAATVFSRSQLLLFLPFTRVRLNNAKRGIQIPHNSTYRTTPLNKQQIHPIKYTSVSQTVVRGPLGIREAMTGEGVRRRLLVFWREKNLYIFYTVTSKNLLLKSLMFLFINTSSKADYYKICCHYS